jgi:GntR family transcriptional regulator
MYLTVDPEDNQPIYRQVADGIKSLIARGALAEGATLPPVRQLAADLGVNLNTIATAYRELQSEGLIVVKHGSGAVVASATSSLSASAARDKNDERLRRPLRAALTELILSGLPLQTIMNIVTAELKGLAKK